MEHLSNIFLSFAHIEMLTCCFQSSDSSQLLDDRGEGVGDDSEHDKDGEEEYEEGGHDELDIIAGDAPVLLHTHLASYSLP